MTIVKRRCFGNKSGQELYAKYHDQEWGIPVHDDRHLFEMLILEGAQAGLSWETILKRRQGYKKAFHNFDPKIVAKMSDEDLEEQRFNPEIIRNRLKIYATRRNAIIFLKIQKEFGTFDKYLWKFVNYTPLKSHFKSFKEVPCFSDVSDAVSKDLKKRGMTFVGTRIIYAYMQAIGMVDDHLVSCPCYKKF